MSNKAASLTGALLSGKDGAPHVPIAADADAEAMPRPAAAAGTEILRQVSLPLDSTRHRRLRLAAAQLDQAEGALMLAALDHYLDSVVSPLLAGRCVCLEEGRSSGEACVAATLASARSERTP